jgi:hypothetical protein
MIEKTKQANTRHGKKKTRVYRIWSGMMTRCYNRKAKDYGRYGGRGIVVCERWKNFSLFYYDMGEPPTDLHQIERKNNLKGYELNNCVWATATDQARNRRSNTVLKWQGKVQCIAAWEQELGIIKGRISKRLNAGWSLARAMTTPTSKRAK